LEEKRNKQEGGCGKKAVHRSQQKGIIDYFRIPDQIQNPSGEPANGRG
jgi:hypothetical protein